MDGRETDVNTDNDITNVTKLDTNTPKSSQVVKAPMVIVEEKFSTASTTSTHVESLRNEAGELSREPTPTASGRFLSEAVGESGLPTTPMDDGAGDENASGVGDGGSLNEGEEEDDDEDGNILPDADFQSTLSISEYPDGLRGETIVDHLPTPLDGGYGWVIVAAAFVSNVIVDGIANSFGPFMASYQTSFGSSKASVSFIGSLLVGTYLLAGPLAGGLLNKYEARRVVIGGSLLSAVAFVLSTFSPNVATHCVLYGVVGGTGFALIYLPAIVCVSQYFERRRALATGISVAGSGVGTFIVPLLCKALIEAFGWKLTLYVLATLILLCATCALLYRPLPVPEDKIQLNEELKQKALLAALSRADFSDDERSNCSRSTHGYHEELEPNAGELSPFRRDTHRTNSQSTNRGDDGQPLLTSMERALSHEDGEAADGGTAVEAGSSPVPSSTAPPAAVRPAQLSPISEARNGVAVVGQLGRGSRAGSQHHHHHSPAGDGPPRFPPVTRNRKTTLTSMTSGFTSMANGMDIRQSRPNLSGQLSRISARSYAQSLSRISQGPQSIKAGDSVLSIALSGVDPKEFNRPMSRRDIFLQGSIRNLKEFEDEGCNYKAYREQHSISIPSSVVAQSLTKLTAAGGPHPHGDIADLSSRMGGSRYSRFTGGLTTEEDELAAFVDDSKFKWIPFPIRNALAEMIDVNLLREPVMLLLCFSNMLGMVGFYVPFVFVMDLAVEKKVEPMNATLLLSIIGITNTVGRVLFGWIADRQWLSALVLNNWSLVICGLLTVACPLAPDFVWLSIYAALFGFVISAYICLTSIVLSDLLGVERLTNSFGLLVVSRGIACLVGTPIAGFVYDATHSYDTSFYFSGSLIVLAGLTSCLIPVLHRHERSKFKNEGAFLSDYNLRPKDSSGMDADAEVQSGKLSVLTERSEENLTEYQRTIQSIAQQKQLIRELEDYKAAKKTNKTTRKSVEPADSSRTANESIKQSNGEQS